MVRSKEPVHCGYPGADLNFYEIVDEIALTNRTFKLNITLRIIIKLTIIANIARFSVERVRGKKCFLFSLNFRGSRCIDFKQ